MTTQIKLFTDNRGQIKFIDDKTFISYNKLNVVRGIHCSPYKKTIVCLSGKIRDFIVNMKDYSYTEYLLTENSTLEIPANYGHCFHSLCDNTIILYKLHGDFIPELEININPFDSCINLPIPRDVILSQKDKVNPFITDLQKDKYQHPDSHPFDSHSFVDYVVLGSTGFLGSYTCGILKKMNRNFICLPDRLEDINSIEEKLKLYKPKYLINATGIAGRPTTKWCETNKFTTFQQNVYLQLQLLELCKKLNIHITMYGSGLIYKGNYIYTETDPPNYNELFYSQMRILLESFITTKDNISHSLYYPNCLYLRILYPISGDGNPKCFLEKLKKFDSVYDTEVNITYLPELIPQMITNLIEHNITGIFNFVNSGTVNLSKLVTNKIIKEYLDIKGSPILDTTKLSKYVMCRNINRNLNNYFNNIMDTTKLTEAPSKIWYAPNGLQAYDDKEITAVVECLKKGWLAGFGDYTIEFEKRVSQLFGKKYGLFVNSGSSANILALCSLDLPQGIEIITPACTFATTVSPIIQLGYVPVFCDVELNSYIPTVDQIISKITDKTRVIMVPNLIGNKTDWKTLRTKINEIEFLLDTKIHLIEDSCDTITHTTESDISTTSFYASHLITAGGSGGMVMFNDPQQLKRALMFRDWGRIGDNSEAIADRFNYNINGIPYDYKFLYGVLGYNFKSSEMNAAFGLVQLDKLADIKQTRRTLFSRYLERLSDNKNLILPNDSLQSDWLAIPLICKGIARHKLLCYLESNNIQTRVCFSGNITKHPAYSQYTSDYVNSDIIMSDGFLLGCHHGMTIDDVDRVCGLLNNYVE